MPSSTSPSKSSPGRLTWRLLAVAAVGWLGCAGYSLCLEPGQRFYLEAARIKRAWAEKMGREHKSRILVYGGSSCAFSINGERILGEQGLPVVNMGLGAGYGARFLTRWALSEARPGDTLIVALEPGLLSGDLTDTTDAVHLSYALHQPGLLRNLDNSATFSLASQLLMLRPGGSHLITLVAKIAGGKPLFRYRLQDISPSGWMQTAVRLPVDSPGPAGALSAQGRAFLKDLADKKKHVFDEDIAALVDDGIMRGQDAIAVKHLRVESGTSIAPVAALSASVWASVTTTVLACCPGGTLA